MHLNHVNHPTTPATSASSQYDVIIVGARAAGAATALTLARNGLRTVLVDQSAFGADTVSTHALMRGAVMQLANWGLLDQIIDAGTPAVRRTTFDYGGERLVISIKPSHGVDALYAPRRTLLDPVIVRAAMAAGAELCDRTAVTNVLSHRGRVVGVRARSADGNTRDLHAPLVIGADGIRSTVARQAGAATTRSGRHEGAVTYGYWSDLDIDGYEWVFRRHGCSGAIPTNDGQVCVFASAPPQHIGRGGVDVIETIVGAGSAELAEKMRRATPPPGTRTWRGRPGFIRRSHGPGWALVGDAGYFKDPISAHGLTDALRDAGLLGRAVIEGFTNGGSMDDALADYEATRDRLSVPLFDIVDRIAGHEWDDVEIGDLLICLSSAMADEVEAIAALEPEPASWAL